MVDAATVALDVLETAAYFAAPALLWFFLYALVVREPGLARAAGIDGRVFWLLVPTALLGTFADLPFFGYGADLLAVNVGGGLIPVVLSVWLLARLLPQPRRSLAELFVAITVATGLALAVVELGRPGPAGRFAPGLAALAPGAALLLRVRFLAPGPDRDRALPLGIVVVLAGLTILATQLTTTAVPGLGIVSAFPAYLLTPVALGAGCTVALRRRPGGSYGPALGLAYAGVTFGVLVGADVLHQPPLYAPGSSALYAIGGAGLLDLLHLSGLLALLGAYAAVLGLRRRRPSSVDPRPAPSPVAPLRRIRRAWFRGQRGEPVAAVRDAAAAVDAALADARRLHRLAPAPTGDAARGWAGLPGVPPWVPGDHANLVAVATRGGIGGAEAYRSWLTARALVALAERIAAERRGGIRDRVRAFGLDLGLLGLGFAAVELALFGSVEGPVGAVVSGAVFTAVVTGAIGWGVGYFLLFEGFARTTPGKRLYGLRVVGTDGAPPDLPAVMLRNVPRVVPISILAYATAVGAVGALDPAAVGGVAVLPSFFAEVVVLALGGFVLSGLLSVLVIAATDERQRLGDVAAGTWVVRDPPSRAPVVRFAPSGSPAPGSSPPAGA